MPKKLEKKGRGTVFFDVLGSVHRSFKDTPIFMDVTHLCNANCFHCFNAPLRKSIVKKAREYPGGPEAYKKKQIKGAYKVIKAFKGREGILHISGGEPFLLPEIYNILEKAGDSFSEVRVNSNGSFIPPDEEGAYKALSRLPKNFIKNGRLILSVDRQHEKNIPKLKERIQAAEKAAERLGLTIGYNVRIARGARLFSFLDEYGLKGKYHQASKLFFIQGLLKEGDPKQLKKLGKEPRPLQITEVMYHHAYPHRMWFYVGMDGRVTLSDHASQWINAPRDSLIGNMWEDPVEKVMENLTRKILPDDWKANSVLHAYYTRTGQKAKAKKLRFKGEGKIKLYDPDTKETFDFNKEDGRPIPLKCILHFPRLQEVDAALKLVGDVEDYQHWDMDLDPRYRKEFIGRLPKKAVEASLDAEAKRVVGMISRGEHPSNPKIDIEMQMAKGRFFFVWPSVRRVQRYIKHPSLTDKKFGRFWGLYTDSSLTFPLQASMRLLKEYKEQLLPKQYKFFMSRVREHAKSPTRERPEKMITRLWTENRIGEKWLAKKLKKTVRVVRQHREIKYNGLIDNVKKGARRYNNKQINKLVEEEKFGEAADILDKKRVPQYYPNTLIQFPGWLEREKKELVAQIKILETIPESSKYYAEAQHNIRVAKKRLRIKPSEILRLAKDNVPLFDIFGFLPLSGVVLKESERSPSQKIVKATGEYCF
ncbi:MAG: radical SAM protein [Candidatus Diapherotrites archaeon]|nr:radical SAM protein [Candidatus Diapherotrites archaeon]